MKKNYTIRGFMTLFLFTLFSLFGGVNAVAQEVVFDFSTNENAYTDEACTTNVTLGDDQIKEFYSKAVGTEDVYYFPLDGKSKFNSGYFIAYTGASLTLPAIEGGIQRIVLQSSNSHSTSVKVSIVDGEGNEVSPSQTWSEKNTAYVYDIPEAAQNGTLKIMVTNKNAQYTKVTLVPTNMVVKNPAGLEYKTESYKIVKGESFTAPTLTNPNNLTVSYASSVPEVAEVDAATGDVTVKGVGETQITASFAGNDQYEAGEASYTLTVRRKPQVQEGLFYTQVTDNAQIVDGGVYLIGAKDYGVIMGALKDGGGANKVEQTFTENADFVADDVNSVCEIIIRKVGENYTFQTQDGYIGSVANDTKFGSPLADEPTESNAMYLWTIEIDADGNAVLSTTGTERILRWNNTMVNSDAFRWYKSGQNPVQLYRKVSKATIGTAEGYGTHFVDHAFLMPAGMEGAVATGAVDGKLSLDYRYAAGDVVPANTALLLKAAKGEYVYGIVASEEAAPTDNLFRGTLTAAETTGDAGDKFYKLTYKNGANLGFYFGAEGGAAFTNAANKAYLALPASIAAAQGFLLDGEATGIENVVGEKAEGAVYTLSGVRVKGDRLPKGIYVKNGKKFIVK